jgi:cytochrome b subunit of formate dehydrogenase
LTAYQNAKLKLRLVVRTEKHERTRHWKNIFVYTLIAGVLGFGLIIGVLLNEQTDWLKGWFGLYERIVILNALVWVEVVAAHYLRLLPRKEPKP